MYTYTIKDEAHAEIYYNHTYMFEIYAQENLEQIAIDVCDGLNNL